MLARKPIFEAKDPRVVHYEDSDDENDDYDMLDSPDSIRAKKKMTGTQALAEFLSTTGPEEFQEPSPKQEPKRKPLLKLRKGHKQLSPLQPINPMPPVSLPPSSLPPPIPQTTQRSTPLSSGRRPAVPQPTRTTSMGSSTSNQTFSSVTTAVTSVSSYRKYGTEPMSPPPIPILPDKKRESSVYSGSTATSRTLSSIQRHKYYRSPTHSEGGKRPFEQRAADYYSTPKSPDNLEFNRLALEGRRATEEVLSNRRLLSNDPIEAGLKQRLARYQVSNKTPPSDIVASRLSDEHIRALEAAMALDTVTPPAAPDDKKKIRHIQTQTLPVDISELSATDDAVAAESVAGRDKTALKFVTMEQLERQLAEEQRIRRRLQAALEETRDHYEVLSGAAYKKLRELWEEKQHWEQAYIEVTSK